MTTAVLIPCFNEAQTIAKVINDFKTVLPEATIYVYDNNSTDGTAQIAKEAGAQVRSETRQGKGNVIRSMFRDIDADCYIMADGDDTYPAVFAKTLEKEIILNHADMVVGDRLSSSYFSENKRPFHNFGNVLVRKLVNSLFRANLTDIMTGARAFNKDFVKTYAVLSKGFEVETEMTIFALDNNFRIIEIPIDYRDRPEGSESKLSTYSDGARVLSTIATLFRDTKPFAFFSTLSIIFIAIFLILFIPIFATYLQTGYVAKIPTLIIASGIFIIAVICFFSGVVLSVLRKQSHQVFERDMTIMHILSQKRKSSESQSNSGSK